MVIGEVPHWYRVAGASGEGFVSKAWTELVPCESDEEAAFVVHTIDVGTGLAVFVQGDDFSLLYDAGSKDDDASGSRNRVLAYLNEVAPDLETIDHVIVSHAHDDHLSLLADVFDRYKVRDVWHSGAELSTCIYRKMITSIAHEADVRMHSGTTNYGSRAHAFGATCNLDAVEMAHPHGARITTEPIWLGVGAWMQFLYVDGKTRSDPNNNSLVLRLDLAGKRVLLAGDAGGGERAALTTVPSVRSVEGILATCCQPELKADILVVGHHGSKTSSRVDFLDAVGARHFIVSSGPYRYSGTVLPDAEVIEELDRRGTVWRTDLDDEGCLTSREKIGELDDGNPGGCHSVVARIARSIQVSYFPAE